MTDAESFELLEYACVLVSAYVAHNRPAPEQVPILIDRVYGALIECRQLAALADLELVPAVAIKKSVTDDFIICLEDGKRLRTLKRYLRNHHAMSPQDYRQRWKLPSDYPMVAPSYRVMRSKFAKKAGLGRRK